MDTALVVSSATRDYFKLDLGVLRPDRWLFAAGSARRVAAMRIGLCALLALRIGLRPGLYLDLSQQEPALFRPLSWAKLFDHMPSRGVLLVALVIAVAAAVCATVGFKGRIALPIAWAAAVFLNGFLTSQGKVVHNDVLLLLCLFVLIPRAPLGRVVGRRAGWPAAAAGPRRRTLPCTTAGRCARRSC